MTSELERIRRTIPEIVALRAARDRVDRALTVGGTSTAVPTEPELLAEVQSAVAAGEPVPDDLGARVLAARRAGEEQRAHRAALAELRTRVTNDLQDADARHADDFLTALAGRLGEILEEARAAVGRLGSARTAEHVVKAGPDAVAAWNRLDQLTGIYRDLRSAQWTITRVAWQNRGAATVFTNQWLGLRMVIADPTAQWDPNGTEAPPWPHNPDRPTDPPRDDAAFVIWATQNPGSVWLPTVRQLVRAIEEQTKRDQDKALRQLGRAHAEQEFRIQHQLAYTRR